MCLEQQGGRCRAPQRIAKAPERQQGPRKDRCDRIRGSNFRMVIPAMVIRRLKWDRPMIGTVAIEGRGGGEGTQTVVCKPALNTCWFLYNLQAKDGFLFFFFTFFNGGKKFK